MIRGRPDPAAAPGTTEFQYRLGRILRSDYFVLSLAAACFIAFLPASPGIATRGNIESVLASLLPILLLVAGQTFVLITGGIDLSIASVIALSSVVGAQAVNLDSGWFRGSIWTVPSAMAAMLVTGTAIGFLNGLAVAVLRMPPFMVTLTSMMFFGGLAVRITRSQGIGNLDPAFNAIGGRIGPSFVVAVGCALAAHILLARTVLGRWLYAVGQNPDNARVSGVPNTLVLLAAYSLCGTFAALASVLLTGQAETGSPVLGQKLLLDVIAAAVIGGVSLFGGRGRILGAMFGVAFIRILDNGLDLVGLPYFVILVAKGTAILGAALLDAWRFRLSAP